MKACTKCGETKPTTEFNKDTSKRDGLCSSCKVCMKIAQSAYRIANAEKIKSSSARRYAENKDKAKTRMAKWYARNKSKVMASNAKWRSENAEKSNAYTAKWYANNTDKAKVTSAKWRLANAEAFRIYAHNRRALKLEVGGKISKGLSERLFKLQRGKCACCGQPLGDSYHMDHIMPLVLGGTNTDDNIQLLRQQCNNQKHVKHPIDFMQSRGFLL